MKRRTTIRRFAIMVPVIGAWASQLVAIGAILAAAAQPFSEREQVLVAVAFYSGIAGLLFLGAALATGVRVPLTRGEVAAVLTTVFPTVLTALLGALLLIPPSP